ncbi:protein-lysine N-methyltransferase CG9154 [Anopheles darlingi]|uniref:protein-lysine N-methyltransferase CG9154 n=1 Tax=Anopheles darlingi TaxID=43151 RepID=UPI0021004F42|nr:protein-lysine N-methyltransferase CG9154 [Anopheles darlingi]
MMKTTPICSIQGHQLRWSRMLVGLVKNRYGSALFGAHVQPTIFPIICSLMATENREKSDDGSDEEEYVLPQDTMLILQQFLREKASANRNTQDECFEENWQLSQFWYNESTKQAIASVVQSLQKSSAVPENTFRVALLSAPSVYKIVSEINANAMLFEFDERFSCHGHHFHQYDYNRADEMNYLDEFRESFDLIIADPPFLSEECIEKMGIMMKKIAKPNCKLLLCSGAVVHDWAKKYIGVTMCEFQPEHERNLGNEFRSYANFDLDSIIKKNLPS